MSSDGFLHMHVRYALQQVREIRAQLKTNDSSLLEGDAQAGKNRACVIL